MPFSISTELMPTPLTSSMPLSLIRRGDEVERLVDVGDVLRLEVGHGGERLPPRADLGGKAVEPLRGAEIQIKIAARSRAAT